MQNLIVEYLPLSVTKKSNKILLVLLTLGCQVKPRSMDPMSYTFFIIFQIVFQAFMILSDLIKN